MTLKCSPRIRKVIKDNADQLYLESQVYRVYDFYHVVICHHCQKYGHIANKCSEKNASKPPTCGKCASSLAHMKHDTVVQQKRNVSTV